MKAFYTDFDKMRDEKYDGMIITGAPVEQMDFEEVTYWDEITGIFDWARTHVTSTLYICWAAASRALPPLWRAQISVGCEDVRHIRTSYLATFVSYLSWF